VPALCASAIVGAWWLIVGAVWVISLEPRLWIIGWFALFAPLEAVVIYAKFFYKENDEDYTPKKSAFDATVEAHS